MPRRLYPEQAGARGVYPDDGARACPRCHHQSGRPGTDLAAAPGKTGATWPSCAGAAFAAARSPRDIAEAIVFLIRTDFITGQVIYVDGGRHLQGYPAGLERSPGHDAR